MPSASQHKNGGRCFIIDKTRAEKIAIIQRTRGYRRCNKINTEEPLIAQCLIYKMDLW